MFDDLMAELESLWGGSGWLTGNDLEEFKNMEKSNALYGKSGNAVLPKVGQKWNVSDGSPIKDFDWGNAALAGGAILAGIAKMQNRNKTTNTSRSTAMLGPSTATSWSPATSAGINAAKRADSSWVNAGKPKSLTSREAWDVFKKS